MRYRKKSFFRIARLTSPETLQVESLNGEVMPMVLTYTFKGRFRQS